MPDYQKGKIYKLWSPQSEEDEVYYGSTCDDLRFRKSKHKNNYNTCSSKILFEKYDDVRIELVEDYPCNNKAELNKKEGEYIRENNCLNKRISGRTQKEYIEDNREKILEQKREYRENNKEKLIEWRENNREKILEQKREYDKKNKEQRKEYELKNREKINEQQRERRRKKKEEALISL
tara:strand:+ start:68 stop:604 length:537 start_codon:yes stop_codon:yes gene_type:complete